MNKVFLKKTGELIIALMTAWCVSYQPMAFGQVGCVKGFLNPQDSYPHNTANPSTAPLILKQGQPLGEVSYKVSGENGTFTLEEYLTKFCITGFLVLKDGDSSSNRSLILSSHPTAAIGAGSLYFLD
jgi:hypothetical protein